METVDTGHWPLGRFVARIWVLNPAFLMLMGACIEAPQQPQESRGMGTVDGGTLQHLPDGPKSSEGQSYVAPPPPCLQGEVATTGGSSTQSVGTPQTGTGGLLLSADAMRSGGVVMSSTGGALGGGGQGSLEDGGMAPATVGRDGGVGGEEATPFEPDSEYPLPTPGEVLVSEVMANPEKLSDAQGEWLELANVSSQTLSLAGCSLGEGEPADPTFADGVTLASGEFLSVARAQEPGFVPDVVMTLGLRNGVDQIQLWCDGVQIDLLAYDSATHPLAAGASLSVSPTSLAKGNNDEPAAFCSGVETYGDGDLGTPGRANPECAAPAVEDAGVSE